MDTEKQYNSVKAKDYETTRTETPYNDYYETPSVLSKLGDLEGKSILDVGCGTGYFTRLFQKQTKNKVIGVDISKNLIELAKESELKDKLGIKYLLRNAENLEILGEFDLVTAIHLLHYISTKEKLYKACLNIYKNLKSEGRFFTFLLNPDLNTGLDYYAKYTLNTSRRGELNDGDEYTFTLLKTNQTFSVYYWTKNTIESILLDIGYKKISWSSPFVTNQGIQKLGRKYWENILQHPWCIFLECYK